MKPSETIRLVDMLKAAFPRAEVSQDTMRLYCEMLGDLDYEQAIYAVKSILATAKFFPAISEIRGMVARGDIALPGSEAAWGEVQHQIRITGRYKEPTFSHPTITRVVKAMGWEQICNSEAIGVERAHFLRLFQDASDRALREATIGRLLPAVAPRRALTSDSSGPVPIAKLLPKVGGDS